MKHSETLSPKEFSEAIGVSESSVKRWADSGLIDVTRTAGGHRRIMLADAIQFVRKRHMRLVNPERLGLTVSSSNEITSIPREPDVDDLTASIREGRSDLVVSLLMAAFIQGSTMADLWDGPISGTLQQFGRNWESDPSGIPLEHEATMVIVDAIGRIRSLLPDPGNDAPVALGGAPSGDPYLLPSLAATAVLTEVGFRTVTLGPNTPLSSFMDAARRHQPVLLWMSLTSERSEASTSELVDAIDELQKIDEVVLGGRYALAHRRSLGDRARVLRTMNELAILADTVVKRYRLG